MARLKARRWLVTGLVALVLLLSAGFYAVAQQVMEQAKRDRESEAPAAASNVSRQ